MSWAPFPNGPWVPPHWIGGSGGEPFIVFEGSQGKVVRTIRVHYNSNHLRGLRVTYHDGTQSTQVGWAANSFDEITLQPGEIITEASLWGNAIGTRTGRIRIGTNRGNTLDVGNKTVRDEFPVNVGSGLLAGFSGRAAADIGLLSFIFLNPVRNVEITDVNYKELPPNSAISQHLLHKAVFENPTSGDEEWDSSNSTSRSNITQFTEASFSSGMSASIAAGVPLIVEAQAEYQWEMGVSQTWRESTITQVVLQWRLSGILAPGKAVTTIATCQTGIANVQYTCLVTITTTEGNLVYSSTGTLRSVQYDFANAHAVDGLPLYLDEPVPVDDGRKREIRLHEPREENETVVPSEGLEHEAI